MNITIVMLAIYGVAMVVIMVFVGRHINRNMAHWALERSVAKNKNHAEITTRYEAAIAKYEANAAEENRVAEAHNRLITNSTRRRYSLSTLTSARRGTTL